MKCYWDLVWEPANYQVVLDYKGVVQDSWYYTEITLDRFDFENSSMIMVIIKKHLWKYWVTVAISNCCYFKFLQIQTHDQLSHNWLYLRPSDAYMHQ